MGQSPSDISNLPTSRDEMLFFTLKSVIVYHEQSSFSLDQGNATPDTRCAYTISATPIRFELGYKRPSGKLIAFLLIFDPIFIGPPEIGKTTPGVRMEFTASLKKSLQWIVLGRRGMNGLMERGMCLFCLPHFLQQMGIGCTSCHRLGMVRAEGVFANLQCSLIQRERFSRLV